MSILDVNPVRLGYVRDIVRGHVTTVMSNRANIEKEVSTPGLVVGAVLISGARSPRLITEDMVQKTKQGAAIVDVAVDQGGYVKPLGPQRTTIPHT